MNLENLGKKIIHEERTIFKKITLKIIKNFPIICAFAIIYLTWENARKDEEKRNGKHIHPVCKLPRTNFLMCFPTLPTHIRSSFYGDKHQKLPRKLNTCAFFYLFIFVIFFFVSFTRTRTFYVLYTLNKIREIRWTPLFPFFDCYISLLALCTIVSRYFVNELPTRTER